MGKEAELAAVSAGRAVLPELFLEMDESCRAEDFAALLAGEDDEHGLRDFLGGGGWTFDEFTQQLDVIRLRHSPRNVRQTEKGTDCF